METYSTVLSMSMSVKIRNKNEQIFNITICKEGTLKVHSNTDTSSWKSYTISVIDNHLENLKIFI